MSFRTRTIRKRPPVHPWRKFKKAYSFCRGFLQFNPKRKNILIGGFFVLLAAFVVLRVMVGAYQWVRNFDLGDLILSAGSELKQDEHGYTNLVLLGDGGALRDGADLVDTIMVASLDHQNKAVTLLSIPRDFYVNSQYRSRINELYRNHKNIMGDQGAFALFQEVVGKIVDVDIHYYMRVDFNAFVEVVEAIGGIDVNVPEAIDDPYYPNETDDGYEPFKIEVGVQHMDGETALKYVRSRKTTSDFDRARRQQLVLTAIREKALSHNLLEKSGTLKKFYGTVKKHINTNMSLSEMLSLARFARNFDRSHLISKVLHDDPALEGGFLYTPEREAYGGQFVLIPYGENYDAIHRYTDLIFKKRDAFWSSSKIEILNATKIPGIAGKVASSLTRLGFNVVNIDNLYDSSEERSFADKTVIRYYAWTLDKNGNPVSDNPVFLEALKALTSAEVTAGDPTLRKAADVTLVLGSDFSGF